MNRLLNLWFLIGKWIMSIGLVLVTLSLAYLIFNYSGELITYKKYIISYDFDKEHNTTWKSDTLNEVDKYVIDKLQYDDKIEKIMKDLKIPNEYIIAIHESINKVDTEDKNAFIDNMEAYYKKQKEEFRENTKKQIKGLKNEEFEYLLNNYNGYKSIIDNYLSFYQIQKTAQIKKETQHKSKLRIYLYSFGGCILLFIIMLIIPILIKIEENTRKI